MSSPASSSAPQQMIQTLHQNAILRLDALARRQHRVVRSAADLPPCAARERQKQKPRAAARPAPRRRNPTAAQSPGSSALARRRIFATGTLTRRRQILRCRPRRRRLGPAIVATAAGALALPADAAPSRSEIRRRPSTVGAWANNLLNRRAYPGANCVAELRHGISRAGQQCQTHQRMSRTLFIPSTRQRGGDTNVIHEPI